MAMTAMGTIITGMTLGTRMGSATAATAIPTTTPMAASASC